MVSSILYRSINRLSHRQERVLQSAVKYRHGLKTRRMGSYTSEWPAATQVDSALKAFFEEFYQISDTPGAHEKYVNQFTKDATFVLGSKRARGSDEILTLRHGMWEKIAARAHFPTKIFPYGPNSNEVMLYGTVEYELKNGQKSGLEWGARALLSQAEGPVKMSFYQVYLDTGAQSSK